LKITMAQFKRPATAVAAAALFAAGLTAVTGGAAYAATYDGLVPQSTSCWNDRHLVASDYLYAGSYNSGAIIDLYYSRSCRTTWARIQNGTIAEPGSDAGGVAQIIRNSDGRTYTCHVTDTSGTCWTQMVNDANVTSYAYGVEDGGAFYATGRTLNY
jgi:hypothetical protein